MDITLEYARKLDKQDILKHYRDEFYLLPDIMYMDGNSLGLLSKRAEQSLLSILDSWKKYGIDGWTQGEHPWFYFSETLSEMCAPLVGALKEEVMITGSTTTNLHQLVASFYHPHGKRTKILVDELNFPSDLYAISSQLSLHGYNPEEHMKFVKSHDGNTLLEEDIIESMTDDIALIVLPSVLYRSGQILNLKALTKAAHERNIIIGFDLCHSIGSLPHNLDDWDVDFAFWCNYKHLNGGPGAVGGLFVNQKHFGKRPGLAGWFGSHKEKQFDLAIEMSPSSNAGAYQIGTPNILSAAPLYGSLQMFAEVGIDAIRSKSLTLTDYMMFLIKEELKDFQFNIANPVDHERRGGHIYLVHKEAARICKALKDHRVIPDFRSPNGIRLAPVALYNSFEDVWNTVQILKKIMTEETYKKYENKRDVVA
ncbi:kynureninase [Psychrobacillus sp. FJAT-21963]|uniref:kynureninase n=1 Tax=Psychrobacillus sp. FJAT-21963 TaxID=1712028 RepID=UPI0006FA2E1B|nr:kynureninase [Psychrobacillus sp. FJAT-21963]KQL35347.1 kynureninase [Psychrobacillus sp. FJAT-21963]